MARKKNPTLNNSDVSPLKNGSYVKGQLSDKSAEAKARPDGDVVTKQGKPKNSHNAKVVNKYFQPVTEDNYTEIRGKVVSKTLRALMPSKKDIMQLPQNVREDLFKAIDIARQRTVKPTRTSKGTFTSPLQTALDKMLKATAERTDLSPVEKAKVATARIGVYGTDVSKRKSVQSAVKSSGGIFGKTYYELNYFIEENVLDISKLEDDQAEELEERINQGVLEITPSQWTELQKRLHPEMEKEKKETINPVVDTQMDTVNAINKAILKE